MLLDSSPEFQQSLVTIIESYDNVLGDEWSQEHRTLTPMPSPDPSMFCCFCGADIFQSFFHCSCSFALPQPDGKIKTGHTLCPTCFVVGRMYSCAGVWKPKQMRKFEDLIKQRNQAVRILRDFGVPVGDLRENLSDGYESRAYRWMIYYLRIEM